MRKALLLAACLSVFGAASQAQEKRFHGIYSRQDLEEGIVKYGKFRKVGDYICAGGLALTTLGIVLAATADYPTDEDAPEDAGNRGPDPQAIIGIGAMPFGLGMAITGLVFHIVGKKKQADYADMLEAISLRYRQDGDRRAIGLVYRF